MRLITLGSAAATAAALFTLTCPSARADTALKPIITLHVQRHTGVVGQRQRVTGSVMFHDPYAGGTYPIDNGSSVLERKVLARPWASVQVVSGGDAGAPDFRDVRRLRRTLTYRLCYRGGSVVTYDSNGREVDLTLAPGCSRRVEVRVRPR